MQINPGEPIHIFYCYAHEDEELRKTLEKHLSPLKRANRIIAWYDGEISAGTEEKQEIRKHLNEAQIILLLISPDFIADDDRYSQEMQQALKRQQAGEAVVIPILLRPVFLQGTPISTLEVLPTGGKPITSWSNLDEAFVDVTMGIFKQVKTLAEKAQEQATEQIRRMQQWQVFQNLDMFEIQQALMLQKAQAVDDAYKIWDEFIQAASRENEQEL